MRAQRPLLGCKAKERLDELFDELHGKLWDAAADTSSNHDWWFPIVTDEFSAKTVQQEEKATIVSLASALGLRIKMS